MTAPLPPTKPVTPEATPTTALPWVFRWLLFAFALLCLLLGVIGLFVPIMPTVVFILLAAWAAARSSPKMNRWMEEHRRFGPMLRNWRAGGVVSRRAKWTATVVMSGSSVFTACMVRPAWIAVLVIACQAAVLTWLWFRPEAPVLPAVT
ncbi:MAG: YbaN family protein [Polaromonas sp.]|nr:YbaN family protein [Polaromonas sp.]